MDGIAALAYSNNYKHQINDTIWMSMKRNNNNIIHREDVTHLGGILDHSLSMFHWEYMFALGCPPNG